MRTGHVINVAARELARGEINFDRFVRRTRLDWKRISVWLYRHWPTPAAVTEEDVEQQLLLCAFHKWQRWDPERSTKDGKPADPGKYIRWNAIAKTTTWLHAQRGAGTHGNPTYRPSRIPTPASWFDVDEGDGVRAFLETISEASTWIDDRLAAKQAVLTIAEACSPLSQRALEVFAEVGDVSVAAAEIYADPRMRSSAWLKNESAASRLVRGAINEARQLIEAAG